MPLGPLEPRNSAIETVRSFLYYPHREWPATGTRSALATQANDALTVLFWKMGQRVNKDVLQNKLADYGK